MKKHFSSVRARNGFLSKVASRKQKVSRRGAPSERDGSESEKCVSSSALRKSDWAVEALEPKVLMSADLMPGEHLIQGSIDRPGDQKTYEFTVDQQTTFLFDGLSGQDMSWQLSGSTGQMFSKSLIQSGENLLKLAPGSYTVSVSASDDTTGDFRFRMLGEEAATTLPLNTHVSGIYDQENGAALYRFDAQAGDRLFVSPDNSYSSYLTLIGPDGNVLSRNSYYQSLGEMAKSGTYWMVVESYGGGTGYGFSVTKQAPSFQSLSLGEVATVDLSQPGFVANFDLDLMDWTNLQAKLVEGDSGARWSLNDASGGLVQSGYLWQWGQTTGLGLTPPGHYRLSFDYQGSQRGAPKILLVDPTSRAFLTPVSRGTEADFSSDSSARVFQRLLVEGAAAAGREIALDFSNADGNFGGVAVQAFDRSGKELSVSTLTPGLAATEKAKRNQQLFDEQFVSAQARDDADAERRLAEAEVKSARENLQLARLEHLQSVEQVNRRVLRSPFPGVVMSVNLATGALVDTSESKKPILKLVQTDKLRVESFIPLKYFNSIHAGSPVTIKPESPLQGVYQAKVTTVDRVIDSASGTFGVMVELDNRNNKIPAGSRCRLSLQG